MEAGNYYVTFVADTVQEVSATVTSPENNFQTEIDARQAWLRQIYITRYRRWQEEQKLLIDTSRYVKPIQNYNLDQLKVIARHIDLPSRPFEQTNNDLFTSFFLASVVLFTSVRHSFSKYLYALFQSIYNYSAAVRLFREQNISLKTGSTLMEFFYLLVLALFAFQVLKNYGMTLGSNDFILFLVSLAAVVLFYGLKIVSYSLLGFISEAKSETNEYLFNMKNYNKVLGIILLPVTALTAWAPGGHSRYFLLSGLIFISIFYLMTLQRGILILLKKQCPIFYLFLYLCTLEFLPLLLVIKAM